MNFRLNMSYDGQFLTRGRIIYRSLAYVMRPLAIEYDSLEASCFALLHVRPKSFPPFALVHVCILGMNSSCPHCKVSFPLCIRYHKRVALWGRGVGRYQVLIYLFFYTKSYVMQLKLWYDREASRDPILHKCNIYMIRFLFLYWFISPVDINNSAVSAHLSVFLFWLIIFQNGMIYYTLPLYCDTEILLTEHWGVFMLRKSWSYDRLDKGMFIGTAKIW